MRYTKYLIEMIRQHVKQFSYTKDTDNIPTKGFTDDLILEYLNDAQDYIQSRIIESYPEQFLSTTEITIDGSSSYTIDDNVWMGGKILQIEYTSTGQERDYYVLDKISLMELDFNEVADAVSYALRSGSILPSPIPTNTSAKLRVTYYREVDGVDIRRGTVNTSDTTSITLENDTVLDSAALAKSDYLCTVDALGVVQDYGVQISSYNSTTRVITIPTTTLNVAAGEFVVLGQYATSHSDLPEQCERFMKTYAQMRIFEFMKSNQASSEGQNVARMEQDIIDAFREPDQDIQGIPVIDPYLFD